MREEDVRIDRSPVPLSGLFWGLFCEGEKKRERFRHSLSTGRLAASLFSTVYHEIDYGWKRLEIRVRPNNLKIILKKKKKKSKAKVTFFGSKNKNLHLPSDISLDSSPIEIVFTKHKTDTERVD